MDGMRRYLSYANVAATLALVLAMSGGAIAATRGFSSGGKLHACVNGEGGLRLLKPGKHCTRGQQAIGWNQEGPAGARARPELRVPRARTAHPGRRVRRVRRLSSRARTAGSPSL